MIFVFDLDGTLCFDGQQISPIIQQEITKLQKNHRIIFASARPIRDLLPLLPTEWLKDAMLIGGNGAITQIDGKIQVQHPIASATFARLKQLIDDLYLDYLADDVWNYSLRLSQANAIEHKIDNHKLAERLPLADIKQPMKLILLNLTAKIHAEIRPHLMSLDLNLIEHAEENALYNIDITAKNINKYTTLTSLIGQQPYIAFGNDMNDMELLQHADYAICVGNFAPLQAVADECLTIDEKAIAAKIAQFI